MDPQTDCVFFRLPPELRNIVYDYVFATEPVEGRIQLPNAQALEPQSALTLTCRRIHNEATPTHQAALTSFWTNNIFENILGTLYEEEFPTTKRIQHISHFVQVMHDSRSPDEKYGDREAPGRGNHDLVLWRRSHNATPTDATQVYRLVSLKKSSAADAAWSVIGIRGSAVRYYYDFP